MQANREDATRKSTPLFLWNFARGFMVVLGRSSCPISGKFPWVIEAQLFQAWSFGTKRRITLQRYRPSETSNAFIYVSGFYIYTVQSQYIKVIWNSREWSENHIYHDVNKRLQLSTSRSNQSMCGWWSRKSSLYCKFTCVQGAHALQLVKSTCFLFPSS